MAKKTIYDILYPMHSDLLRFRNSISDVISDDDFFSDDNESSVLLALIHLDFAFKAANLAFDEVFDALRDR